jgi:hypothetical protein
MFDSRVRVTTICTEKGAHTTRRVARDPYIFLCCIQHVDVVSMYKIEYSISVPCLLTLFFYLAFPLLMPGSLSFCCTEFWSISLLYICIAYLALHRSVYERWWFCVPCRLSMRRVLQFFVFRIPVCTALVYGVCVCGCEVFSSLLRSSYEISVHNVVDLALPCRRIHVQFDVYVKYK